MSKAKLVSGVLCRDDTSSAYIVFVQDTKPSDMERDAIGLWGAKSGAWIGDHVWLMEHWKAEYDLTPPRKGRCFEVEIEL